MKGIKPVAWSWFYISRHCTLDEDVANELMGDGVDVTPLFELKEDQEYIQKLETDLKKEHELSQSLLKTIGDIRTATGDESLMIGEIAGRISELLGKPE